ncbi:MAG: hypothetical protein WCI73_05545 [Phycisphaerae bacterium]
MAAVVLQYARSQVPTGKMKSGLLGFWGGQGWMSFLPILFTLTHIQFSWVINRGMFNAVYGVEHRAPTAWNNLPWLPGTLVLRAAGSTLAGEILGVGLLLLGSIVAGILVAQVVARITHEVLEVGGKWSTPQSWSLLILALVVWLLWFPVSAPSSLIFQFCELMCQVH